MSVSDHDIFLYDETKVKKFFHHSDFLLKVGDAAGEQNTQTHAYTHANSCTHTRTHIHTHTHTHTHSHTHKHMQTCTRTHAHTHAHAHTYTGFTNAGIYIHCSYYFRFM